MHFDENGKGNAKMSKHFRDYGWKGGIPYGKGVSEENLKIPAAETYKIIMDPYRKRISIEKYDQMQFASIIYDSALLDFRHLKSDEQTAWQKTPIANGCGKETCIIRNQDDRILFVESYLFEGERCRECIVHSPHGHLLSKHKMFYTGLNDSFNGVILFDCNERPVMRKSYNIDESTGEFTDLTHEEWDMIGKAT